VFDFVLIGSLFKLMMSARLKQQAIW